VVPSGSPSESYTGLVGRAKTTVWVLMRHLPFRRVLNVFGQVLVYLGKDSCCHRLLAAPRPKGGVDIQARTVRERPNALDRHA